MGFSLFTQELAIDLGTANTVIFQNDKIVLDEPSIIAMDTNNKVVAIGRDAKRMHERENPGLRTVRPLQNGVIADFTAAENMIRGF
ncbi:MAG: rod shape-determining protein, partial [Bacteroidales bacterium]|nr:rod shape-determining protein [Bacteroidales bacterium]